METWAKRHYPKLQGHLPAKFAAFGLSIISHFGIELFCHRSNKSDDYLSFDTNPSFLAFIVSKFWPFCWVLDMFQGVFEKIKFTNFDLKFSPWIGLLVVRMPWKFQTTPVFLSWDIEFPRNNRVSQTLDKNRIYLEITSRRSRDSIKLTFGTLYTIA